MTKTYMQKTAEVKREWHLIDAEGKVLGQLATEIAIKLIGKHKTTYTPHIDGGDYIVVVNASKIVVTGNKLATKNYYRHSGFPGGFKVISLNDLLNTKPERVIETAVYNMLPKNKLRDARMDRLKVYGGAEHKHYSQLAVKKTEVETK